MRSYGTTTKATSSSVLCTQTSKLLSAKRNSSRPKKLSRAIQTVVGTPCPLSTSVGPGGLRIVSAQRCDTMRHSVVLATGAMARDCELARSAILVSTHTKVGRIALPRYLRVARGTRISPPLMPLHVRSTAEVSTAFWAWEWTWVSCVSFS